MPLRRPLVLAVPLVGALLALPASSEPVPIEGSWLTGDTHVHTDHSSDGSGPRQALDQRGPGSTSVGTQVRAAERRGLDFLPITDHRTYDQHWHPEWTSSQLVLVPGEEANGGPHANVLGAVDQTVDGAEPPGAPGFRHVQQSIWDVHAQDAAWQTNHPDDGEVGDDGRPNANASAIGVDTVEVLNSDSPEVKLDYAEDRWNAGFRFGVVGASDSHFSELDAVQGPGLPATRLLAGGRSERHLLDALRAGRTALTRGNGAPVATLTADTDADGADDAVGGDERVVPTGSAVDLRVRVERGTGYDVLVYASPGRSAGALATFRPVLPDETFTVPVTVPDGDSWYRVEVRGPVGVSGILDPPSYDPVRQLQAATSPVFLSTDRLPDPRPEIPVPATGGADDARVLVGARGGFTGFADVAAAGADTHVVAEQHLPGRTAVVHRRAESAGPTIDLAPASAAARFPRVAAAGSHVAVVWQDERSGQTPRRADVYLRQSFDGGRSWQPEQRLTDGTSRSERPVVALLPSGEPVVAWQDNRDGAFEVLVQRVGLDDAPVDLSRAGKTIAAANPFDSRSARYPASVFPSLAVAPSGAVSVGWQDNRTDPDPLFTGSMANPDGTAPDDWEVLVVSLPPGAPSWSAPVSASADSASSDRHPTLLYDRSGVLHVAWDTKPLRASGANLSVLATSSADGGATFAAAAPVGLEPTAMSHRPRLALDRDGAVRAVWYDTRSADWRWKVFSARHSAGSWTSPEQLSGAGNGTWPTVSEGRVVFTSDRNGARAQRDRTHQVMLLRL